MGAISNAEMAGISAEQLIGTLPDQRNFYVLAGALADLDCRLIGDCMAPRNLMIAIHEGHAVGCTL